MARFLLDVSDFMPTDNPLANLADIHLPATLDTGLPAIGWWLLVFLLITGISAAWFYWQRYQQRTYYRVEAKTCLKQIKQQWLQQQNPITTTTQVFRLLRRYFRLTQPEVEINRLRGQAWLDFIGQQFAYRPDFDTAFSELPYQKDLRHYDRDQHEKLLRQVNTLIQQTEILIKNA